jgi:hypothetical protein
MQCSIELIDAVTSPLRWKALILDPPLAVRRSVWNAVSAFDVALLASMSLGTTSWIAMIELDAASALRFSKSCKALAREWSPSIRAS